MEPRLDRTEAPLPRLGSNALARVGRREIRADFEPAGLAGLPDPAQRDRPEGQEGTEPRAVCRRPDGTADSAGVAPSAAREEVGKDAVGRTLAAGLAIPGVGGEAEVAAAEDSRGLEARDVRAATAAGGAWHRRQRGRHPSFPEAVPAVARREPPDDAGLRELHQLDPRLTGPAAHAPVAGVGDGGPGLLVGDQQAEAELAAEPLERCHRLAAAGHQPDAERAQGPLDVDEAFALELGVARIPFGLPEDLGLVDEQRHDRAAAGPGDRRRQGRMIGNAEIALQPDDDGRNGSGHRRGGLVVFAAEG